MTSLPQDSYIIKVAVPSPLPHAFSYSYFQAIGPGTRVLVPFGPRQLVGVTIDSAPDTPEARAGLKTEIALKPVRQLIDQEPVFSKTLMNLAYWLSHYYFHPLGEVFRTMLPAGSNKVVKEFIELTPEGIEELQLNSTLKAIFGTRKKLTPKTFSQRSKPLKITLNGLEKSGMVVKTRHSSQRARASGPKAQGADNLNSNIDQPTSPDSQSTASPRTLTHHQSQVIEAVCRDGFDAIASNNPLKPFLIHGVTGSGKTEIFLQLIAEAMRRFSAHKDELSQNFQAQTIVLVPEIALTPQMTRVFAERFPGVVSVVHSGMGDTERWEQLERMRSGEAAILIGPRSAIFAPCKNLKLIVVDEEHDSSYKQNTGLCYNGRDVAVVRAKFESAVVVLGSATPSLESFNNTLTSKYHLLSLPERVTGRALPEIRIIQSSSAFKRGVTLPSDPAAIADIGRMLTPQALGIEQAIDELPIDEEVIRALRVNLEAGNQAIVLVNRRGYAYFLFSLTKKKAVQCPRCSISLTLHSRSTQLRCHYCDYRTSLINVAASCPGETLVAVGYGSQKAEDCLRAVVPSARIMRVDSDTVSDRDLLPEVLNGFRNREIDILVGTQILAKGHDFPNVTLIAILEIDQSLNLPDFRAGERTFQLLVQAAGRAGRAHLSGQVLVQCSRPNHPIIQLALSQDYILFARRELEFRRAFNYPPFRRLTALEYSAPDLDTIRTATQTLEKAVDSYAEKHPTAMGQIHVSGPLAPSIEVIRGRFRRMITITGETNDPIRKFVNHMQANEAKLPKTIRSRIDVDPLSLG